MFVINVANPVTLLLLLVVTVLLIFLGKELKKSYIPAIPLCAFLALIVIHVLQYILVGTDVKAIYQPILNNCLLVDFVMIFVTFFAYLWVDDIDSKAHNKKSIDNSLDWFWKKV